jgi:hypothetical protein
MIWAIVKKSGEFEIRFDDPAATEKKSALRNRAVWPLEREPIPHLGERVSFDDGSITFSAARAAAYAVPQIKAATQVAILREVPMWRQVNDIEDPDSPGKAERKALVAARRIRSNELEQAVRDAVDVGAVAAVLEEVYAMQRGS